MRMSLCRLGLCAAIFVFVCALFPHVARADASNTQGMNPTITLQISAQEKDVNHAYKGYLLVSGDVVKVSGGLTIESPSFSQGTFDQTVTSTHVSPTIFENAGASAQDCASAQALIDWLRIALSTDAANRKTLELALALQDAGAENQVAFSTNEAAKITTPGYWLITSDDAQPMLILVYEGMDAAAEKTSVPVINSDVLAQSDTWSVQADYSAGTDITYRIAGTLPTNVDLYDAYPYKFVSTIGAGITPTDQGVKSYLKRADGSTVSLSPSVSLNDHTFTVSWEDLAADVTSSGKTIAPTDVVVVEYSGEQLNKNATLGVNKGNVNTVVLMYPRSPTAFKTKTVSSESASTSGLATQGLTAEAATTERVYSMGESVPTTVTIYCYALAIQKVDASSGASLPGATFTIMDKKTGKYFTTDQTWSEDADEAGYVTGEDGTLTFAGLGSGTYVLTEVAAPDGYTKLDHTLTVTIASTVSTAAQTHEDPTLTVTVEGDDAEVTSVDAGSGIATVRVSDTKASGSNSHGTGRGGASSANNGSNSSGATSRTGAMTSLARTGDPAFWGACALLASSGGAALWSGIRARNKRR